MYEFLEETVERNMTSPAKTVAPEVTTGDLLRLFAIDDLDAYPVVSDGELVGIVSKADALKLFSFTPAGMFPHYDEVTGTTVDEIMSRQVVTASPHERPPLQEPAGGGSKRPPAGRDRAGGRHSGARSFQPAPGAAARAATGQFLRRLLTRSEPVRRSSGAALITSQPSTRCASVRTCCGRRSLP